MDRLTVRIKNHVYFTKGQYEETLAAEMKDSDVRKVLHKLAAYEDAEEQGRLLKLPCKVGDTVYRLWYTTCHLGNSYPDSYECSGCYDECDMKKEITEFVVPNIGWIVNTFMSVMPNSVYFLTREEAEAKLREGAE